MVTAAVEETDFLLLVRFTVFDAWQGNFMRIQVTVNALVVVFPHEFALFLGNVVADGLVMSIVS